MNALITFHFPALILIMYLEGDDLFNVFFPQKFQVPPQAPSKYPWGYTYPPIWERLVWCVDRFRAERVNEPWVHHVKLCGRLQNRHTGPVGSEYLFIITIKAGSRGSLSGVCGTGPFHRLTGPAPGGALRLCSVHLCCRVDAELLYK